MADPVSPAGNPTPFLPEDIFGAFGPCPETDAERMRRITSQVCMKDRALCLEAARKQAASLENLVRGQNPSHFSFPYPVEGIFYATDHFPPSLTAVAEAAKAVFPIVRQSEKKEVTHLGTMVSVSADGEFATVPHVLYDISDHISTRVGDRNYYLLLFRRNLFLRAGVRLVSLREEQVTNGPEQVPFPVVHYKTKARSIALIAGRSREQSELPITLKLPLEGRSPFIRMAKEGPRVGERVFTISFPETNDGEVVRRVSTGHVIRITDQGEIITTARVAGGSSGGALVNSEGELVGLITKGDDKESTATLSTQLFLNRTDKSIGR